MTETQPAAKSLTLRQYMVWKPTFPVFLGYNQLVFRHRIPDPSCCLRLVSGVQDHNR